MENFMELIPDEILLEIMGYLLTKDILKNLAQVSKRFHRISKDPDLIKKIVLVCRPRILCDQSWTKQRRKKYYDDLSKVLKESQKLRVLSLDFGNSYPSAGINIISNILPYVNPQCLEEFRIRFKLCNLESLQILLNYLEKCPKMKTLTLHIWNHGNFGKSNPIILKTILGSKFKKVEKVHLIYRSRGLKDEAISTIKNALKNITENLPEIKHLNLDLLANPRNQSSYNGFNELCPFFQQIATEKNITIAAWISNGRHFVYK